MKLLDMIFQAIDNILRKIEAWSEDSGRIGMKERRPPQPKLLNYPETWPAHTFNTVIPPGRGKINNSSLDSDEIKHLCEKCNKLELENKKLKMKIKNLQIKNKKLRSTILSES